MKKDEFMSFYRGMDEARNHHSQQTNTGTENQTLHVLTDEWELITMRTHGHREGNITHRGLGDGGLGRDSRGWGDWGGIALGEISNVDDRAMYVANHHHGTCIPI